MLKSLPDIIDSELRGMYEITPIKTIITKVIIKDLISWEIMHALYVLTRRVCREQQRRFRSLTVDESVPFIPYRAHCDDDVDVRVNASNHLESISECGGTLIYAQQTPCEFTPRSLMAVTNRSLLSHPYMGGSQSDR